MGRSKMYDGSRVKKRILVTNILKMRILVITKRLIEEINSSSNKDLLE